MFDSYISVLKTVVAIVAGVLACLGAITAIPSASVFIVFSQTIGWAFEGGLQAALWVTVGFVIAERCGYKKEPWKPADLPPFTNQSEVKIPLSGTIAEIALTVIFICLFFMMVIRNNWLFIIVLDSETYSPFSQAALNRFTPYLFVFGGMGLVVSCLKLYWGRWNIPLCIASVIRSIIWVSLTVIILRWSDLMNEEFVEFMRGLNIFPDITMSMVITVVIFGLIIIALIDIGSSIRNTWKSMR